VNVVTPDRTPDGPGQGLLVETLLGVAASLSASGDFDNLLANILEGARKVMRCAACSISLPDAKTGGLLIHSTQRDWHKEGPWRLPKGQGIASKVFETREAVNITDAAQHPLHHKRTAMDSGLTTHALLTIPLMDGSPAIDAGNNLAQLQNDQRGPGFARAVGLQADIGAFEVQAGDTIFANGFEPLP
jgi:transcriptional regulator with GAF, ATPase, and Fis domain